MIEEGKKTRDDAPVELESQFILRLPPTPAASLRAAVKSGVMNLEDRLAIQLEADMRHATVQFDKWALPAKLYDLPTIIESCKTLDKKIFYKTADICQIMICNEGGDASKSDEEISPKKKDKDVKDKRYILPHGLTPPLKNVRKRRFRKTLKKKYVDLPDVEKEVKRLLRTDTEAISVRYEIVNAEDEKNDPKGNDDEYVEEEEAICLPERELSNSQMADAAEYELFGGVLSSSEDSEEEDLSGHQMRPSTSRKPTRIQSVVEEKHDQESNPIIDLAKSLQQSSPLVPEQSRYPDYGGGENDSSIAVSQLESATAGENLGQILKEQKTEEERMSLMEKLDELEHHISNLQAKRRAQELEIMGIDNQALKQRFQVNIDRLKQDEYEKQMEYNEIMCILQDN